MVESALEYLRLGEKYGYTNFNISAKASRVPIMVAANRLMASRMLEEGMRYPLHLGVTEAGDGDYARVKSAKVRVLVWPAAAWVVLTTVKPAVRLRAPRDSE